MKQRFFTNTVVSNFIKALVYNTPIPHIKTMNSKSYLIKDNDYLYKDKIIHCTKTGMFKPPKIDKEYTGYYKNGELKISKEDMTNNGYVELSKSSSNVVDNLTFGQYYPKHTELYCSEHSYYDSETHEHLGELLRCYRDIYDINLMPYYNCVSGRYQPDIVIGKEKTDIANSAKVTESNGLYTFDEQTFINYVLNQNYRGILEFILEYDISSDTWLLNGKETIDNLSDLGIGVPEINTLYFDNTSWLFNEEINFSDESFSMNFRKNAIMYSDKTPGSQEFFNEISFSNSKIVLKSISPLTNLTIYENGEWKFKDALGHETTYNILEINGESLFMDLETFQNSAFCDNAEIMRGKIISSKPAATKLVITCDFKDKPALYKRNNNDFKTYRIPIKFNTTYTLALDCNSKVIIAPALLSKNHIINSVFYNIESESEELKLNDEMMLDNGYTFNSLSFTQPVTLGINTLNKEHASILQKYEKYLYLLIQIPKDNDSSIVLLEGDYTDAETIHIFNGEELDNLSDLDLSELMTSGLSLLQLNDHVTYPFADRLIEYLLLGVICSRDEIFKNIERIQEVFYPMEFISQVWDNKLRNAVYLNFQRIGLATRIDLNGFVDSNTEALIKKLS